MALVGNKIKPFKRPFNYGVKFLVEIMVWITMFFMNAGLWGILVTTDILPSFNNSGKIVPDFIISVFLILILYLPTHLPYFWAEHLYAITKKQRILWYLSFILTTAAALYSMRWS